MGIFEPSEGEYQLDRDQFEKKGRRMLMDTKTKATHTPGLWNCRNMGSVTGPSARHVIVCGQKVIARMGGLSSEDYANARLIAQAPAMVEFIENELEALRLWQRDLLQSNKPHNDVLDGITISIDKAEAILAKVRGEQ